LRLQIHHPLTKLDRLRSMRDVDAMQIKFGQIAVDLFLGCRF
jgi:hypothetical protein